MSGTSRNYSQAPTLAPESRGRLLDALYQKSYTDMPREEYDRQMGELSDLKIADAAHSTFYSDVPRADFNQRLGLTSADGSTQGAIVSGMTFGLSDEVGAAAAGVGGFLTGKGFSEPYNRTLNAQRDNATVYRQNNPYLGAGLELAGGLLTGAPAAGVQATTKGTIATAAGMGAAQGFGQGEGTEERLWGATGGAALGAGMAALVPLALRAGQGAVGKAVQAAGLGDTQETGTRLLLKALEDDGLTPREVAGRLAQWQREGAKPETLFDMAGENTRRLARASAGRMGPGTDRATTFLAERQADQAGRVIQDAETALGQRADDFFTRRQELVQQRSQDAAPLYERAFAQPAPTSDRLQAVLDDPISRQGLARGLEIQRLENTASASRGQGRAPVIDTAIDFAEDGTPIFRDVPNMRSLDAVKRGLDEIIEDARDSTTGRINWTQRTRAVDDVRRGLVEVLDNANPAYAEARAAWSGPSSAMDAMAAGRGIFNAKDADIARQLREGRGRVADAEFFQLGVTQAIQEAVSKTGDGLNVVRNIFGSPAKRSLLRAAFPSREAFDAFRGQMMREAAMFRNGQFVSPRTGSQTALRQDEAGSIGGDAANMAFQTLLNGGNPVGPLRQFVGNRLAGAKGLTPEVADNLVGRLFTSETPEIVGTLRQLNRARSQNALADMMSQQRNRATYPALTSGAIAGYE